MSRLAAMEVRRDRWTEAEEARLREVYPTSRPIASIAAAFGRSEQAVKARASTLGLRRPAELPSAPPPTPDQVIASRMRREGWGEAEIAARLRYRERNRRTPA